MYLYDYSRERRSLDGVWQLIPESTTGRGNQDASSDSLFEEKGITEFDIERENILDFDIDDGMPIDVPGSFCAEFPGLEWYEGRAWHTRRIEYSESPGRTFLKFGAVNYTADVWLNGQHLGTHEGGYTPFSFDVTDVIEDRSDNLLVVLADNRRDETSVPAERIDWYNWGGIIRSVSLIEVPETFLRNFKIDTAVTESAVTITATAWLDGDDPTTTSYCSPWVAATIKHDDIESPQGRVTHAFRQRMTDACIRYLNSDSAD